MEFIYKGHKIEEYIDGRQYLVFEIACVNNMYPALRITNCIFTPVLNVVRTGGLQGIGKIGAFPAINCPTRWIYENEEERLEFSIPLNPILIEKMIEARIKGMIHFAIRAQYRYEYYDKDMVHVYSDGKVSTSYLPKSCKYAANVQSFTQSGEKCWGVTFTAEESRSLLEELKHYELIRFEIPVRREIKGLEGAVKQLKSAEDNLRENKLRESLLDIRQALTAHLMKPVEENDKRVWKLKDEVKDAFLKESPTEMKESYETVLKRVEETLRQQIRIMNDVFLHKDSDKLKVSPLREDVEEIFSIVSFATKYLAQRINNN